MKTTKRALFSSVMALILCFSMLVGTTFAWFTDSVESGVNQIVAGTLDVELYNAIGIDETKKVSAETKLFDEIKYWEPGVVAYENLTVANLGNLALKYQLSVNFDNATANVNGETLAKVLKVGFVEGGIQSTTREGALAEVTEWLPLASFAQTGELAEQNETNTYGIVIYWEPSDIDNDFNMNNGKGGALSIDLGIKLVATQLTAEYDSFGNDYDSMAGGKYHVQFGFNNPADLLAFAPVAGDAASSGLSITPDGKAQIDKSGAWYEIEADLSENEYVVEYELDITDLAIGENVTVDTGEQVGWGSTPIMLERGSTKVYYGLAKNEYIGELQGTVVTVTHVYKYNSDNKLEITTIVSDGVDSVTYTKAVASSAQTKLYWDIYFVTEAGKATMDDFSVKTADAVVDSSAELGAVIAQGGEIVLSADIVSENGFIIERDVAIDLNGHTLTATGNKVTLFQVGDGANEGKDCHANLTIVGGKIVLESTNGVLNGTGASTGAAIAVDFMSTGKLEIRDTEIVGSRRGGQRAVEIGTGEGYLKNVTIDCAYGSGVNAYWSSKVVLDDCNITVNGMYSAPYNSVCFSAMYGAEITVNSGNYKMVNNNTYSTGDSHGGWVGIIMNSGGTITTNGGTFENVPAEGFNPAYERAIFEAENNAPAVATLNLLGGTFIPQEDQIYSGYGDQYQPTFNVPNLVAHGNRVWVAAPAGVDKVIMNAVDLLALSATRLEGTYALMADIDLGGADFNAMIVNYDKTATFLGNGHTISNVNISSGPDDNTTGQASMFYGYERSTLNVSDLTLKDITVTADISDNGYAAAVIGYGQGNAVLSNVDVVNATIYGEKSSGLLVGHVTPTQTLTATDCDLSGTVTLMESANAPDGHYAGKYIGTLAGSVTLTDCTVDAALSGSLHVNNIGAIYGRKVSGGKVTINGSVPVSTTAELIDAIKNAPVGETTYIAMADGNYDGNVDITLAAMGKQAGDVVIKAAGKNAVITGTVTLGYYNSGTGAAKWMANVTFEGVTFDHAENAKHSINVQSVNGITLDNCKIIGDGEFGIESPRGNDTGASLITGCTFENAGMQLLGKFTTGLVIEKCEFNNSRINIQAGDTFTVQNCTFNCILTDANNGDSFYVIRTSATGTPITVKDCKINVDSTVNGIAAPKAGKAFAIFHNRHASKAWTIENVEVNLTDAALAQTELKVVVTAGGAMNTTNVTVNGTAYTG